MPPRNALSPAPYSNQLLNQVPSPGWEQRVAASKPPGYTMSEWLSELQYGFGKGLGQAEAGNLEFYHDVATRPVGVYEDLVAAAKAVAKNPSLVVNGLRAIGQQAASGPRGLGEVVGGFVNPRNFLKPKPQKPVVFAIDKPYNFKKESQRVSNLVHAENVTFADYEPKVRTPNKTYAYVGKTNRSGNATRFELKRDFENGTGIRVYVGSDYPYEDLPDPRYDPNNPPLMYASTVAVEGTDVAPAPVGRGAATQMTLEALNIAKRGKGGWMSEGMGSLETQAKYKRLIDAGVPFQRLEDGTYYLMPEDLATLDLNKVSEALNKKYAGRK